MVTILASPSSHPLSREAISLVCEAVPGTKGALRKRKVYGGREEVRCRDHGKSDLYTERADKNECYLMVQKGEKKRKQH